MFNIDLIVTGCLSTITIQIRDSSGPSLLTYHISILMLKRNKLGCFKLLFSFTVAFHTVALIATCKKFVIQAPKGFATVGLEIGWLLSFVYFFGQVTC